MKIRTPGKVHDRLWFLGWQESCVYLLEGSAGSILINGGVTCLLPDVVAQLREFRIDQSKINKFLVLHSHFDHVGVIPYFMRRNPKMALYASPRALQIFSKPKAIQVINDSNRYVTENRGLVDVCSAYDLDWRVGFQGIAVREGDSINLGDLDLQIIETPGHSPCSISAYVPQLKALFPSEAAGIPYDTRINTYGTSNFTHFEASLQKMKNLPVEYLCSDHCGCVIGDQAANYISQSIEAASWRKGLMQEAYARTGSVDAAAREMAERFEADNALHIVSAETFTESYRQMIMHIVGLKPARSDKQAEGTRACGRSN